MAASTYPKNSILQTVTNLRAKLALRSNTAKFVLHGLAQAEPILQLPDLRAKLVRFRLGVISQADLEKEVTFYSQEELREFFEDDPWLGNYIVNHWEYMTGATVLTTYPWNVCIPIADICNATCSFCNSWIRGKRWLDLAELDGFRPLLKHAKLLGLAGHGEPLIHPEFEALVARLEAMIDPRCWVYLITNGYHLERRLDLLRRINVRTYNISLNGATPATHHQVMGMGPDSLDRVLAAIEHLIYLRDVQREQIRVTISMVVTRQNVSEAAAFVRLGNRLKVNEIYLRTLMPVDGMVLGLNYHLLPPYLDPDFIHHQQAALQAMAASKVPVLGSPESWATPIFPQYVAEQIKVDPPPALSIQEARKHQATVEFYESAPPMTRGQPLSFSAQKEELEEDNPYHRNAPFNCKFVYQNLNLNDFYFKVNPCCYMADVPGFEPMHYDGGFDFFEIWNSPGMIELRRRLNEGPLFSHCRRCPPTLHNTYGT